MSICQREGCEEEVTHMVGWQPAASRTVDRGVTVDRSWFYGCTVHARWVWKLQHTAGACPVFRSRA